MRRLEVQAEFGEQRSGLTFEESSAGFRRSKPRSFAKSYPGQERSLAKAVRASARARDPGWAGLQRLQKLRRNQRWLAKQDPTIVRAKRATAWQRWYADQVASDPSFTKRRYQKYRSVESLARAAARARRYYVAQKLKAGGSMRLFERHAASDLFMELRKKAYLDDKDRAYTRNVVICHGCLLGSLDLTTTCVIQDIGTFKDHMAEHARAGHRIPPDRLKKCLEVVEAPLKAEIEYLRY